MKIRFDNATDWSTLDVRRLFLACAKHEGMAYDGTYVVELYYPRGGCGWGYYNRRHMKLGLRNWNGFPEDRQRATEMSARWLAATIIHEMGHNRGLKHKDMSGAAEAAAAREVCDKLGMIVVRREVKRAEAKPSPTRQEKARANMQRIVDKLGDLKTTFDRDTRRWTKKLAKARASVRRYDRIAAMPTPTRRTRTMSNQQGDSNDQST